MSRIGREPIAVPAGVTVTISDSNLVTVKGPLGELQSQFAKELTIAQEGATLTVTRPNDQKEMRALHGLTRTLINNMVVGVTKGYEKKLEIVGVGYRVEKQAGKIVLVQKMNKNVGFQKQKLEAEGYTTFIDVRYPDEIETKF